MRIKKITFHKYFVFLILLLFVHGALCYTIIGITYNFMLSQIIGITIMSTYYYNLVSLFKPEELINVYLKMAFWVAVIGYPLYFFGIHIGNPGETRFYSFFKEPAHYVIVVLPACYYYYKAKKYFRFIVIFCTLILSSSSLGYLGCGLLFLLPNLTLKRIGYSIIIAPILLLTFYFIYTNFPFFRVRVDDTYESYSAIGNGKFKEETNLSSYALISNLYIAKCNVIDHPFGSGIGSHLYMHEKKYLPLTRPPKYLIAQDLQNTNAKDANSLFIRIISEMGILGLLLVIVLVYFAFSAYSSNNLFLAQGIVIYILLKLFRDGHYFAPEFFFFIWLLYFSIKEHREIKTIELKV